MKVQVPRCLTKPAWELGLNDSSVVPEHGEQVLMKPAWGVGFDDSDPCSSVVTEHASESLQAGSGSRLR